MKKLFFPFLLIGLLAASCSKEKSFEIIEETEETGIPDGYHLVFTVDGERKEYPVSMANRQDVMDMRTYSIMGATTTATETFGIIFSNLSGTTPLVPGVYENGINQNDYVMTGNYLRNSNDVFQTPLDEQMFEVNISAVSDTEIAGTFEGRLLGDGGEEMVITNGSFRLEFE